MDNVTVKDNIRKTRKDLHLTQKELADKLGISRTAYRNLEQGDTRIFCDHIPRIASLSGKSPEELVLGYRPVDATVAHLEDSSSYQNKLNSLSHEYETQIEALSRDLENKNAMIDVLKTTVMSLQETVRVLKSKPS